jgi:hypothetical protein
MTKEKSGNENYPENTPHKMLRSPRTKEKGSRITAHRELQHDNRFSSFVVPDESRNGQLPDN